MEEMGFTTMKTKRNIWEEFCYDLIEARDNNVLEDEYQAIVETNLRQLGWSKVQGEICPKERINVGSHNQIEPDITIKTNNTPIFVIELKRPNNSITRRQEQQLLSYMRLRRTLLGLYIGHDIRLYVDVNEDIPTMVWSTEIELDAPNGEEFVDFFLHETFNRQRLENICKIKANSIKTDCLIGEFKQELANDCDSIIKKIISDYFISLKGCDGDLVNAALNKLTFTSKVADSKTDAISSMLLHSSGTVLKQTASSSQKRDSTKYSVDGGKTYFGKGRFVREFIANFVKLNPNLTFGQLSELFPDNLQGSYGVIRSCSDIASSSQNKNDLKTRYVMSSKELLLTSSDGVNFAVCNQWGSYNIVNFLNRIKEIGWIIVDSII